MSVLSTRATRIPDLAEQLTELRSLDDIAVTTSTYEPGVPLLKHTGELPGQFSHVAHTIEVTAMVLSLNVAGNNSYTLQIWSDTVADASNDPEILLTIPIKALGQYLMEVDAINIPENHEFIGVRAVLSGTSSPQVNYGAHITGSRVA